MIVRPFRRAHLGMVLLALVLAWPGTADAQYTDVPAPAAYALENVTVVHADGRRDEGVTILVRGRLIESVGTGLTVPPDARVLDGEDLVVYPGLIDAHGDAKYSFPKPDVDRQQVRSWDPPRTLQGFTPHRRVVDALEATGADVEAQRKRGIVAVAVHPTDAMMPGQGTLLLLRNRAKTSTELVLEPVLGPVMTFRGGQGAYPGTLFGVQAFYRQSFEDAEWHGTIASEYERDSHGMTPPAYDPDYEVLQQARAGHLPVYFYADGAEDIRRALELSERYGLQLTLLGGQEAWKVAAELEARDIPVLASVDFDSPKYWSPDTASSSADTDPLILKEQKRFEELYANAARLSEAGVRFALTSGGGDADLRAGVRKAIEYGLDEATALRAVTSTPAGLLGVPNLVQIEDGSPANFTVATGALFDEDTRIAYTFTEGELEEVGESQGPTGDDAPPAVDVSGRWEIEINSEAGAMSGTMTLRQTDATFSGSIAADQFGDLAVRSGTVAGNRLSFLIEVDFGGESIILDSTATVEDDELSGSSQSPVGNVTFEATRISGPGGDR